MFSKRHTLCALLIYHFILLSTLSLFSFDTNGLLILQIYVYISKQCVQLSLYRHICVIYFDYVIYLHEKRICIYIWYECVSVPEYSLAGIVFAAVNVLNCFCLDFLSSFIWKVNQRARHRTSYSNALLDCNGMVWAYWIDV